METKIVYFDESGDDGNNPDGSPYFILTSIAMDASDWKENYNSLKNVRKEIRKKYGLHTYVEMHMKDFLYDHNPYRQYKWSYIDRRKLLLDYFHGFIQLKFEATNVIIDKNKIISPSYPVLENALKYNLTRIDTTYHANRNFLVIADEGRVGMMRKTARAICVYNQIPTSFYNVSINAPVKSMIEDILEKKSEESIFIQLADSISYFVNLYYKVIICGEKLPSRVSNVINEQDIIAIMDRLVEYGTLNLNASKTNEYGLVIYPKQIIETSF